MKYSKILTLIALMTALVGFSKELQAQCPAHCVIKINAVECARVAIGSATSLDAYNAAFSRCVDAARQNPVECRAPACSYNSLSNTGQINKSFTM